MNKVTLVKKPERAVFSQQDWTGFTFLVLTKLPQYCESAALGAGRWRVGEGSLDDLSVGLKLF